MKIRPVKDELLHAWGRMDEETDRQDEANSRFSQFCENAENSCLVDRLLNVRELYLLHGVEFFLKS